VPIFEIRRGDEDLLVLGEAGETTAPEITRHTGQATT
jgi:hypothetical protein